MLLLLLGSTDLSDSQNLKQGYANDYKEIINLMKINKINELKRLGKSSINYEILVDMVKSPVDLQNFITKWMPMLKEETTQLLQKFDDKLSELLKASDQLQLQIDTLKSDIENLDFIKCNEMRMDFIKTTLIPICLQYWTNSTLFKIFDSNQCPVWHVSKRRESNLKSLNKLSSQNIFFEGIPNIIDKLNDAKLQEADKDSEDKIVKHQTFK